MYHVFIVYMHERTLLSDDESVVSVTRREQQLEQTYLTICFWCFVLFWFYFGFIFVCLCRILVGHSLFICVVVFFLVGHCIAFPSIYGLPLWYLQTFLVPIMSFYSEIIKLINKHYTVSRSIHNINN